MAILQGTRTRWNNFMLRGIVKDLNERMDEAYEKPFAASGNDIIREIRAQARLEGNVYVEKRDAGVVDSDLVGRLLMLENASYRPDTVITWRTQGYPTWSSDGKLNI